MMAATDRLLKRPAVPLRRMSDIRFLLIILEVCLYQSLWPITTNATCLEPIIGSTQLSCRDQVSSQLAQASIWYAQLSEQWMSSRTCQLVLKVSLILFVWEKTPCSYMSARYTTEGLRNKVHLVHAFITYRITRAQRSKLGLPAAYESEWRIRSGARTMAILCKCLDPCFSCRQWQLVV